MKLEVVQATRAAFTRGLDDETGAAMLDVVASFAEAERAAELRAVIDELPAAWLERRIVEGGILDAAAAVAAISEALYRVGRPEAAAAELFAFLEALARTLKPARPRARCARRGRARPVRKRCEAGLSPQAP